MSITKKFIRLEVGEENVAPNKNTGLAFRQLKVAPAAGIYNENE
jgi:hypothetical protein